MTSISYHQNLAENMSEKCNKTFSTMPGSDLRSCWCDHVAAADPAGVKLGMAAQHGRQHQREPLPPPLPSISVCSHVLLLYTLHTSPHAQAQCNTTIVRYLRNPNVYSSRKRAMAAAGAQSSRQYHCHHALHLHATTGIGSQLRSWSTKLHCTWDTVDRSVE
ncbi:hypothetical protein E2C01_009505 [Portunus trituberculatus]|uniref:Uncharacterized protein n=1 Tax=Portunus trituberculatus TaxID=210409 RepID=A0A5B7D5Y9_PORTR|nr:hypothetical protein [Portunus trituberculatus]